MRCRECRSKVETKYGLVTECQRYGRCTYGDDVWELPEEKEEIFEELDYIEEMKKKTEEAENYLTIKGIAADEVKDVMKKLGTIFGIEMYPSDCPF